MSLEPGHYRGTGVLIGGNGTEWGPVYYNIEVGPVGAVQGLFSGRIEPVEDTGRADPFAEFRPQPVGGSQPKLRMADGTEVVISYLPEDGRFDLYC